MWVINNCVRCESRTAKKEVEGLPTCEVCEGRLKAAQEPARTCPVDGQRMKKKLLLNVLIDRCPSCNGVWLDRSELETIQKTLKRDATKEFGNGFLMGTLMP